MSQGPYGQQDYQPEQYDSGQYNPYPSGQNPYEAPVQQYQPYGPPSPYQMQMAPPHPRATLILVLGIIGVTVFNVLSPFAWFMGSKALKEIDSSGGVHTDRGQVVAGKVMGIVGSVFLILWTLYFVFMIILLIWSSSMSSF
ncbi:MAG: DUF4190 domain-containing protein [Propionibacteriales bacterium]|nr:DUF4190 domain-containing protein [Propionibacteriales bacterium]